MAESNQTNNFSDQSDDNNNWDDFLEIDSYNIEASENTMNIEGISKHVKASNEWICHKCHYANNRHLAITQNNYHCSNCEAELFVNEKFVKEEETKYDNLKVETNTENDEIIAKILTEELTVNKYNNTTTAQALQSAKSSKKETINKIVFILQEDNYIMFKYLIKDNINQKRIIDYIRRHNWNDKDIKRMSINNFVEMISSHLQNSAIKSKLKILYHRICDRINGNNVCKPETANYRHKSHNEHNYKNIDIKNDKISKLMLPTDISSTLLPIHANINSKYHQIISASMSMPINRSELQTDNYRPSLCNGIYGSYYYIRKFASFKYQSNEIQTNVTKT
eukprot:456497_1